MERVPRISRAQSMDALSSQSALTGYYGVQLGGTHLNRVLPKITTAAGTIGPAKVLVMGPYVIRFSRRDRFITWRPIDPDLGR
jgi:NAD(P) transhydrogenase subunit alpha